MMGGGFFRGIKQEIVNLLILCVAMFIAFCTSHLLLSQVKLLFLQIPAFLAFHTVIAYLAFLTVNRYGAAFPGTVYGVLASLFYLLVSYIYSFYLVPSEIWVMLGLAMELSFILPFNVFIGKYLIETRAGGIFTKRSKTVIYVSFLYPSNLETPLPEPQAAPPRRKYFPLTSPNFHLFAKLK